MFFRKMPKIIQFVNLLHKVKGDTEHSKVEKFLQQHQGDSTFMRRANTLKELFIKANSITREAVANDTVDREME